jgi:methyltransferase
VSRVAMPAAPVAWGLELFLAVLLIERVVELAISRRNIRALKARGAHEYGAGHFPLLVFVHVLFPLGLAAEVLCLGARPGALWPLWLLLLLGAQALRASAIRALGRFWSVRVLVVPGAPLVRRGPYRFLRHPNYLAVTIELLAAPLLFGAWRTALVVSMLNAVVLGVRTRVEGSALQRHAPAPVTGPRV